MLPSPPEGKHLIFWRVLFHRLRVDISFGRKGEVCGLPHSRRIRDPRQGILELKTQYRKELGSHRGCDGSNIRNAHGLSCHLALAGPAVSTQSLGRLPSALCCVTDRVRGSGMHHLLR